MRVRETFKKNAARIRAALDATHEGGLNDDLEKLAGKLPGKIKKFREKHPDKNLLKPTGDRNFVVRTPESKEKVKALPGYQHLHDVCVAENIKIEDHWHKEVIAIRLTLNEPYCKSPEAGIYGPVIQLKFPGL